MEALNEAYSLAYNSSDLIVNILIDNNEEHYVILDDLKFEVPFRYLIEPSFELNI
jgi:hypothetical protein